MRNGRYPLDGIYRDVAYRVVATGDDTETAIRCWINDEIDGWLKAGFQVTTDYSQEWAIKKVREYARNL